ncbi:MAG: hypothetical protein JHC85_09275 [Chthoniobacterales bacterium]|nr:hypothetical protein [Chthoniobacterales bacterium]
MKKLLTPLLICGITSSLLAGGTSGGPWANGAYYSGYLNGKYMGVVTGNNIAGVLGFGISDGAPPFRTADTQSSSGGNTPVALANSQIRPDVTQNYFVIFVEGRTYSGLTTAGIDIDSQTVAGALQGTDPVGVLPAVTGDPGPGAFAVNPANGINAFNALSVIDRGLNGGFTAKVKSQGAVFTFKGDGQLSTPANQQSYQIESQIIGLPAAQTNAIISGIYETDSTPFQVKGIRTSYTSFSLQGSQDQSAASAGTSATTGGN